MAADTSIAPTGFTVASASCQYVIGRDNGLANQPDKGRLVPPYTNSDAARTLFLAQISTPGRVGFETSEGFSVGGTAPFTCNFTVTTATIDVISGSSTALEIRSSSYFGTDGSYRAFGRYGPYGNPGDPAPTAPLYSNAWNWLETESEWKITFSPAVRALGFYGVDLGDWTGSLSLKIYYSDATTETVVMPYSLGPDGIAPWNQSMTYIGLLMAKNVDRIDFLNTSTVDKFGFDEFTAAISSQVTFPTPPVTPTVEPTPPASLSCGPSLGPSVCSQSCPVPVPTWVPVVYSVITSGQPTGLTLCGHSLGRQTC